MSKLMKATAWGKREFENGSIPDNRTIKRWIENGYLRGRIIDGAIWVFSSEKWGVECSVNDAVNRLIREA